MVAAAGKKALVLSLTLAIFSVDEKVPERHKCGMSDWSILRARKRRTIFNLVLCPDYFLPKGENSLVNCLLGIPFWFQYFEITMMSH